MKTNAEKGDDPLSQVTTGTPRLAQVLRAERSEASRILRKADFSIRMVKYIRTYKGVQFKSKLQYTAP
jgi:hypothetical protein